MKKYIQYDKTGKILRYGVCSNVSFAHKLAEGQKLIEPERLELGMDVLFKIADPEYSEKARVVAKVSQNITK